MLSFVKRPMPWFVYTNFRMPSQRKTLSGHDSDQNRRGRRFLHPGKDPIDEPFHTDLQLSFVCGGTRYRALHRFDCLAP